MTRAEFFPMFLEFIFVIIGLQFFYTAYRVAKDPSKEKKLQQ